MQTPCVKEVSGTEFIKIVTKSKTANLPSKTSTTVTFSLADVELADYTPKIALLRGTSKDDVFLIRAFSNVSSSGGSFTLYNGNASAYNNETINYYVLYTKD